MFFDFFFDDVSDSDMYVQKRKECMCNFLDSISSAILWLFDQVAGLLDLLIVPTCKVINWLSTLSGVDWLVIGLIFAIFFIIGSAYVIMKFLFKLQNVTGDENEPPFISNEYYYSINHYQHPSQQRYAFGHQQRNNANLNASNLYSNPYLPTIAPDNRDSIQLSANSTEPIRLSENAIFIRNEPPVPGQTTITELSQALNRIFRNIKDPIAVNTAALTPNGLVTSQMRELNITPCVPDTFPNISIDEIMRETNRRINYRRRLRSLSDDQLPAIEHSPELPQFGVDVVDEALAYPEIEED